MGGLAGAIKRQWPIESLQYIEACRRKEVKLGDIVITKPSNDLLLVHVAGQLEIGPETNLFAVAHAFVRLQKNLINMEWNKPVYIPYRMGCGLGGGDWDTYLKVVSAIVPDVIVVARPEDLEKFKV